jgi:hypothetical protein
MLRIVERDCGSVSKIEQDSVTSRVKFTIRVKSREISLAKKQAYSICSALSTLSR